MTIYLKLINLLLFALLPLTLFGYSFGCMTPLIVGVVIYWALTRVVESIFYQKITLVVSGLLLAVLGLVDTFVVFIGVFKIEFDCLFFLLGFIFGITYSLIRKHISFNDSLVTLITESAFLILSHVLFFIYSNYKFIIFGSVNNSVLKAAINISVIALTLLIMTFLIRRTTVACAKYRIIQLNSDNSFNNKAIVKTTSIIQRDAQNGDHSGSGKYSVPKDTYLAGKWLNLVEPVKDQLEETEMIHVVVELFKLFATTGRNVPSVFGLDNTSTRFTDKDYALLKQVTLADHSFRVAELSLNKIKEKYAETWQFLWPMQLIISLGHDISKIPELTADYSTSDHGINSANYIASLFRRYSSSLNSKIINPIIEAIRDHHKKFDDNRFSPKPSEKLAILIECDREAREIEKEAARNPVPTQKIEETTPQESLQETSTVFDNIPIHNDGPETDMFLEPVLHINESTPPSVKCGPETDPIVGAVYEEFIKPGRGNNHGTNVELRDLSNDFVQDVLEYLRRNYLNRKVNKAFYAISQEDGYVYCWTDTIYDLMQLIGEKKGSRSVFIFSENYKYSLLLSFYRNMKASGFTPPDDIVNSEKYYANSFTFIHPKTQEETTGFYMLISADAFGVTSKELEMMRMDEPELTHIKMKPVDRKKRG